MKLKDFFELASSLTAILVLIASLIFSPVLVFTFAYVGGMILDWAVGETLTEGLNLMFDTTRFTRDLTPLACATLATIGRYFTSKATATVKADKEKSEKERRKYSDLI